jgi:uncharacterized membrane protein HdeD (DUF308 family)
MKSMSLISILFGVLLVIVGVIGFIATGSYHPRALIPCALGFALILSGLVGRNDHLHHRAMQIAMLVALFGFGGTVTAFAKFGEIVRFGTANNGAAPLAKMTTGFLCAIFLMRCLQSFLDAGLAKKADSQKSSS